MAGKVTRLEFNGYGGTYSIRSEPHSLISQREPNERLEMRLLCGEVHHTAFSTQLSLEAQVQGFSGLFVRTHTGAAKNRPDLGLGQIVCVCLCHDGFDAPAPSQGHRSKRIASFDVIVAVESLAHAVGQVLRKGIHRVLRGPLTPLRDLANLQCCFLVCEDVHCWRNSCKTRPGNESVHLQEKVVGERVLQHLISLFRTASSVSLNEFGHVSRGVSHSRPLLKLWRLGQIAAAEVKKTPKAGKPYQSLGWKASST